MRLVALVLSTLLLILTGYDLQKIEMIVVVFALVLGAAVYLWFKR